METDDIKKLALSIDGDIFFNRSIKNLNWFNIVNYILIVVKFLKILIQFVLLLAYFYLIKVSK